MSRKPGAIQWQYFSVLRKDVQRYRSGLVYTFNRPADYPNIDQDIAAHREVEARILEEQRVAEARRQNDFNSNAAALLNMYNSYNQGAKSSNRTSCYADTVLGTTMVRCY